MTAAAPLPTTTVPELQLRPIRRALMSVSDKAGLVELATALAAHGVELLSTGGSAQTLRAAGLKIVEVADYTGFPEMLDGRVKTLHPKIHGGLLQKRDDPAHQSVAAAHDIPPLDLVVVNLYPFAATVARGGDYAACVEHIDIGGPAMVRSAAKNHADVAVLTDPAQYPALLAALAAHQGATPYALRQEWAQAAYAHTAAYDAMIAGWFAAQRGEDFPTTLTLTATRRSQLRYGENPQQRAAYYVNDPAGALARAQQVLGESLSYNNLSDTDAAFELVSEFTDQPAIAIIKHANPCGVAVAATQLAAWQQAFACDTVSPYGGIIACNRPLDAATAAAIGKIFVEVIIAPAIDDAALALLAAKKKQPRILLTGSMPNPHAAGQVVKTVSGGYLVQSRDALVIEPARLRCVTKRQPTEAEKRDLLFAFTVAKHVKSNTIVYAKHLATVGVGAGQMSRVDSARIAVRKAEEMATASGLEIVPTQGAVAASDAFFPFADGLQVLIEAGVTAVIQPGGSIRDDEVIAAADAAGIAMLFTGVRHFRH
jgi:phosphoribosylaminoimidazolecarboxamide formyltransferase / IMP cyclohydrolase